MPTIGSWNGHTFQVSGNFVRGFTDLTIQGGCETTTKNSDKQKYEERKYGNGLTVSITVSLNALVGVTDVFGEAMGFIAEATEGACDYFYLGGEKLIPSKLMLTDAKVGSVIIMPGQGSTWIACDIDMTLKQGTKNDGSTGGSGSGAGGSAKASVKTSGAKATSNVSEYAAKINAVKSVISQAKASSNSKLRTIDDYTGIASGNKNAVKNAATTTKTATKIQPTTGRDVKAAAGKLTLANETKKVPTRAN